MKVNGAGSWAGEAAGSSGHQRPRGLEGDAFQGRTEAAALSPSQGGGDTRLPREGPEPGDPSSDGEEHPSHQGGSGWRGGQTRASDGGPLPLSLLSPLSIVTKRRDAEAAPGASPRSSRGLRALRAVPLGLGAHPHARPQVRGPAPGPPPNAPLSGSKDQREKESPKSSRATQKSSVIQGFGR